MLTPTIHLNGTSRGALLEQYTDAARALRTALRALAEAAPNGRDYYPQGPEMFARAVAEHRDCTERVASVLREVEALASATAAV